MKNHRIRCIISAVPDPQEPALNIREPLLHTVAIRDLRPTQMTVGMREVHAKRKAWDRIRAEQGPEFLGSHMIPVILGPKDRHYVIDHHHLARALLEEGQKDIAVTIVKNLKHLETDSFWFVMDNHSWMHPFDDKGRRGDYGDLPKSVADLVDDPFRSLAGELRHIGGYAKDTTPFSEFLWADFLRRKLTRKAVDADFDGALEKALKLAKSDKADYLPGWCGPVVR
ncbi:MAG: ParB-like protein [Nevskia sp.]